VTVKKGKAKGIKAPKGSVIIELDWLHTDVLLIFNDKQRDKLAKQFKIPEDDDFLRASSTMGGMASTLYKDGLPFYVLFIPNNIRRVVIHECTHMVHMVFDEHGIPVAGYNTEAIAYMTDYLCEQVFGIFDEMATEEMAQA